jgi:phosphomannomutase
MTSITCFKAYDIRGRVPEELNEDIAYRIGKALVTFLDAKRIVVGHDIRLSSPALAAALKQGICDQGADVLDIGLCGSEEVYFATGDLQADGGVIVTASHNPTDYNGLKFVREDARPISGDNGLFDIRALAEANNFAAAGHQGQVAPVDNSQTYIRHLLGYIDVSKLRPLRVVVNAGNGGAGKVIDLIEPHLPFEFIKIQHEANGHFPHGVPNPLLPENRAITAAAVREHSADMGIAWDGDFDRCFFFDETGKFIEGYYLVGLLAQTLLANHPGEKIIHDPRLTWNTQAIVKAHNGLPVLCKTGHAFIKDRMRTEDALYGGEMSAHHYFRDFYYCDSGMIPWLLIAQLLSDTSKPLSALVQARIELFPVSGEINRKVADPAAVLQQAEKLYANDAIAKDYTDGLSMEFSDWRFNLRASNTEPVIRLNIESRGDQSLMAEKRDELLRLIEGAA